MTLKLRDFAHERDRGMRPTQHHSRPEDGDRVSELRADLALLRSQLYGPGEESLFLRLRLQEELQKDLEAWKKTLITRFWQVVLAIITTVTMASAAVWWEHSAKIFRLEEQMSVLARYLPSL